MAVIHCESWDKRAIGDLTRRYSFAYGIGTNSINATGDRLGGPCLVIAAANHSFSIGVPNTQELLVHFPFMMASEPDDSNSLLYFYEGTGINVAIRWRTGGILEAYNPWNTSFATGATGVLTWANQWHTLSVRVKVSNTVGEIQLWFNGVSLFNVSGKDTQASGNAYTNIIAWQGIKANFRVGNGLYVQDLVAPTAAYLGDKRSIARVPNGAGASAQFTPSAGANWQNVDEADQDDDTTYNESTTPGHIDSFTKAALGITGTVSAVQLAVLGRKTDAGARTLRNKLRSGGAYYDGATVALGDTYAAENRSVWSQNPDGPAAWDVAGVDAAEMGYELVA